MPMNFFPTSGRIAVEKAIAIRAVAEKSRGSEGISIERVFIATAIPVRVFPRNSSTKSERIIFAVFIPPSKAI